MADRRLIRPRVCCAGPGLLRRRDKPSLREAGLCYALVKPGRRAPARYDIAPARIPYAPTPPAPPPPVVYLNGKQPLNQEARREHSRRAVVVFGASRCCCATGRQNLYPSVASVTSTIEVSPTPALPHVRASTVTRARAAAQASVGAAPASVGAGRGGGCGAGRGGGRPQHWQGPSATALNTAGRGQGGFCRSIAAATPARARSSGTGSLSLLSRCVANAAPQPQPWRRVQSNRAIRTRKRVAHSKRRCHQK
jgi:hypothetical protein